jgi:hypothetical protein
MGGVTGRPDVEGMPDERVASARDEAHNNVLNAAEAVATITPEVSFAVEEALRSTSGASAAESQVELFDGLGATATNSSTIFNFYCDYTSDFNMNMMVLASLCQKFSLMGCCAATGLSMLQQNPIGSLSGGEPVVFPPCMYKYLYEACPTVDLKTFCSKGAIASTTTVTGTMFMPKYVAHPYPSLAFPNMYNKTAVLGMQGAVSGALAITPGFSDYPYLFNKLLPLQVQIVDFMYYGGTFFLCLVYSAGLRFDANFWLFSILLFMLFVVCQTLTFSWLVL